MKRLFLDTEFNGFQGALLSLALVPEDSSEPEFYRELICKDQLDPWVLRNVVPHLFLVPISTHEFQSALATYLWNIGPCAVVCDWPDDIRHFCSSLITGPGEIVNIFHKIQFVLDTTITYNSKIPHNALHDARAIRDYYLKQNERTT